MENQNGETMRITPATSALVSIGLLAGVVAGLYLAYRRSDPMDKMYYQYKAGNALASAKKASKSVSGSAKKSLKKAENVLKEAFD